MIAPVYLPWGLVTMRKTANSGDPQGMLSQVTPLLGNSFLPGPEMGELWGGLARCRQLMTFGVPFNSTAMGDSPGPSWILHWMSLQLLLGKQGPEQAAATGQAVTWGHRASGVGPQGWYSHGHLWPFIQRDPHAGKGGLPEAWLRTLVSMLSLSRQKRPDTWVLWSGSEDPWTNNTITPWGLSPAGMGFWGQWWYGSVLTWPLRAFRL